MDHIEITESKINVSEVTTKVTSPCCGAVSVFLGTTRNNFNGKQVLRLEYEAYSPMAEIKIKEICDVIRLKWDVKNIAVVHRIGLVPLSEASVIIAISSPHRQASLEAVQFAIDTLKATVPIWKKEIYGDESSAWKENKECSWKSSGT